MTEKAKNHMDHAAKFTAAFLQSRYPEPGTLPENAQLGIREGEWRISLLRESSGPFLFRRAGKQPS